MRPLILIVVEIVEGERRVRYIPSYEEVSREWPFREGLEECIRRHLKGESMPRPIAEWLREHVVCVHLRRVPIPF